MGGSGAFASWRQCAPRTILVHGSLDPPKSTSQTISQSVQPFLHSSRHTMPIRYNGPLLPLKNCPFAWRSGPCLMHGSLAHPTAQLKRHHDLGPFQRFLRGSRCDRQTDRPRYSVCNNRPHTCAVLRCGLLMKMTSHFTDLCKLLPS